MSSDFGHLLFESAQGGNIKSLAHKGVAYLDDAISDLSTVLEHNNIYRPLFRGLLIEIKWLRIINGDIVKIC